MNTAQILDFPESQPKQQGSTMGNFANIPAEVILDGRLSKMQLRVLLALYSFWNRKTKEPIYPKRESIAKKAGYSPAVISRTTTQLEKLGWVTKIKNNGGYSSSAHYILHIPGEETKVKKLKTVTEPVTVTGSVTVTESATKTVTEPVTPTVTESVRGNKQTIEQTNEHTPLTPQGGTNDDAKSKKSPKPKSPEREIISKAFGHFWENMKTRKVNKPAAKRAFAKAVNGKTDDEIREFVKMILADHRDRKAVSGDGDHPFNRLHPATYLNGERWNDDPEEPWGSQKLFKAHPPTQEEKEAYRKEVGDRAKMMLFGTTEVGNGRE